MSRQESQVVGNIFISSRPTPSSNLCASTKSSKPNSPSPPTETSILQQFPKTLSSPGTMGWHQSLLSIHLLLFHSEDVILKMYFRGELSEAKEEEDRALTSPTKLALWLSCSLL